MVFPIHLQRALRKYLLISLMAGKANAASQCRLEARLVKKTKLKKMRLTIMWPTMYSWAEISHLSCLAKAASRLQEAGKMKQTAMLTARKQAEVGIIGVIGVGPGRSSTKTQVTHCTLLKRTKINSCMCKSIIPDKCQDCTRDSEGPDERGECKD